MKCQFASSGCNYPESECLGVCMNHTTRKFPRSTAEAFDDERYCTVTVYKAKSSVWRWVFVALLLAVIAFLPRAFAQDSWLKTEFKEATYGVHLFSDHAENRGTNNGNLGVYIRTKSGWTAGHYHNSCHTYTNYYGWTSPEIWRVSFTPGIASGYHCLTEKIGVEEGKRWSATIIPSIRILSFDNVAGFERVSLRAVAIPGLAHLMLEAKIK